MKMKRALRELCEHFDDRIITVTKSVRHSKWLPSTARLLPRYTVALQPGVNGARCQIVEGDVLQDIVDQVILLEDDAKSVTDDEIVDLAGDPPYPAA